jgi:hypothetical protein
LSADKHELAVHVRAGAGLVVIDTHDEPRAAELLRHVAREVARPVFIWSAARGLKRLGSPSGLDGTFDQPAELLRHIDQRRDGAIFLLADFHPFLDDPVIARLAREISRDHDRPGATLVLVGHNIELPDSLKPRAVRFELATPSRTELEDMIREEAAAWKGGEGRTPAAVQSDIIERLVLNLNGLAMKDARRLVRNAIHKDGMLSESDLPDLMKTRFELLDPSGALSFELDTERFTRVAGMPRMKKWLQQRKAVFTAAEAPKGLDPPRGLLLLGVQGCGKSLAARAVAGFFGVPLLHLDAGALFNRFHGESERNLRRALAGADRMEPCVLWIDEIEKGMATGDNDGGTSKRMLASFLTWMAERESRVFLVATANDITSLPPELVRKGRFDEVFFVDLPDRATRREILGIHLARRDIKPMLYDIDALAEAAAGFSGAELEHAVVSGLYAAHAEQRELSNADILEAIRDTRPLSVMMAEPIEQLRDWARERAVPA